MGPTHNLKCVSVDQNDGELDDLMSELKGVALFTRRLKVNHADIVIICVCGSTLCDRLHQLQLLIVALQPLPQHIFYTSNVEQKKNSGGFTGTIPLLSVMYVIFFLNQPCIKLQR